VEALRAGRAVAILDDAGREGETDLYFPGISCTPDSLRVLRTKAGAERADRQTDRWTDGQADGRTDGQTGGWPVGQTDGPTKSHCGCSTRCWAVGQTARQTDPPKSFCRCCRTLRGKWTDHQPDLTACASGTSEACAVLSMLLLAQAGGVAGWLPCWPTCPTNRLAGRPIYRLRARQTADWQTFAETLIRRGLP
jgi:3,4-dihydroxy-2-butanone 4-phosphate synthase